MESARLMAPIGPEFLSDSTFQYFETSKLMRGAFPFKKDVRRGARRHCLHVPILAHWSLIDRSKKLPAHFFATPSGHRPVREWILELSMADRKVVGRDIQKVEFGWPLGMPYCRSLGDGLWEVRSDLMDGRIGRVIFCVVKERMVLLHGFVKKTQKTSTHDLDLARKRMKELD